MNTTDNTQPKQCPFCGEPPRQSIRDRNNIEATSTYYCDTPLPRCPNNSRMTLTEWNYRPREAALQKQVDEKDKEIAELKHKLEAFNTTSSFNNLCKKNHALQKRIDELEEAVDFASKTLDDMAEHNLNEVFHEFELWELNKTLKKARPTE